MDSSGPCGAFSSSTMIVMIMASTPSLNASIRFVFMSTSLPGNRSWTPRITTDFFGVCGWVAGFWRQATRTWRRDWRHVLVTPAAGRAVARFRALCGQGSPFDPHQPAHIVGEIGQRDFGRRAGEVDGADDQVQAAFLGSKDVLDPGPHL